MLDSSPMRLVFLICFLCSAFLSAAEKKIETVAGNGKAGYAADQVSNPYGIAVGPDGALYICEIDNHVVRRLDLKSGKLSTVAGNARKGYSGDGGPATAASLNEPYEVRFDKAGHMFFVEMKNHVVRRVDAKTGIISTVAGTGQAGFAGDGGPAKAALLNQPHSIQFDPAGNLLICDIQNNRIRVVDMKTGMIMTWAGTGEKKPTPDGAPLQGTPLWGPRALDFDAKGNAYLALREGNKVFRIDMTARKLVHLAGTGEKGYAVGPEPAKSAKLSGPKGISWSKDGGVYLADTESHTIRRVDLKSGMIETVAGTGAPGDGPETSPLECKMKRPHGVFVDKKGVVYIGDSEANRVRRLR